MFRVLRKFSTTNPSLKIKKTKLTEMCNKKGVDLLHDPIFNKGNILKIGLSYEMSERDRLSIRGLIPPVIRSIEA